MFKFGDAMSIFARSVREPVGKFALPHPLEQIEILRHRPIAKRAVLPGRRQRAAIFANLIGVQIADIRLARLDQLDRPIVICSK